MGGFSAVTVHMPRSEQREPLEVLIVDDEPDIRDLLSEYCTAQGFRVAMAQDGRAAVQALERANPPFPIVIADLHLPYADGFAVLEAARRASASCYVIIVTGYATIDGAVRAVKAGAYDFLAKPFALGQLDVLFNRIRDRIALESENRMLTRRMSDDRPFTPGPAALHDRVRLLEDRVAALERLLAPPRKD
jgi:DNA-binding NtrC family response regulator